MLSILNQPFPTQARLSTVKAGIFIGLFVAVFLLFFQPFGLHKIPAGTDKFLKIAGYGIITFLCVGINAWLLPVLFPGFFNAARWTVKREIAVTLFNFLVVGFCNTLYTFLIFQRPFNFTYLLYFEAITLAVGIIPVAVIVLFRHNRLLQYNLKLAQEMNSELHESPASATQPIAAEVKIPVEIPNPKTPAAFTFISENANEQVTIARSDFLFAATADNYVELHFVENGLPKKSLIRSTLTRIEEAVAAAPKLVRCHRAYLVNLEQVRNFSGNAQGLKLELNYTGSLIPVSRKMVPEIKSLLHG